MPKRTAITFVESFGKFAGMSFCHLNFQSENFLKVSNFDRLVFCFALNRCQ